MTSLSIENEKKIEDYEVVNLGQNLLRLTSRTNKLMPNPTAALALARRQAVARDGINCH